MTVKEILAGFLRKINSATGRSDSNLTDAVNAVSQKAEASVTAERTTGTNSVTITPKMTVTKAGLIKDDAAGDPQTVRASDVVSGERTFTRNGLRYDVTNYKYATVNVPSPVVKRVDVDYLYVTNVVPYGGSADLDLILQGDIEIGMTSTILAYAFVNGNAIFIRYTPYKGEYDVFDGDRWYNSEWSDLQFEFHYNGFRFQIPYNYYWSEGLYDASYESVCVSYDYT